MHPMCFSPGGSVNKLSASGKCLRKGRTAESPLAFLGAANANLGVAILQFPGPGAGPEKMEELRFPAGLEKEEFPIDESLASAGLYKARPKV